MTVDSRKAHPLISGRQRSDQQKVKGLKITWDLSIGWDVLNKSTLKKKVKDIKNA